MKFKAVVFDLDGTLLNTLNEIAYTVNSVLKRHNLPTHDVESYRQFIGDGVIKLVYRSLPEALRDGEDFADCLDDVLVEYGNNLNKYTVVYDGITKMLDELTRLGVRMAILSNKAHEFMPGVMEQYFTQWKFEFVFGARKGLPVKPNPFSAIEIAKLMNLPVEEIIYIGDSDVDMKTAIGAGMYPVGAGWGLRGREELLANGAKLVIDHPLELINCFK